MKTSTLSTIILLLTVVTLGTVPITAQYTCTIPPSLGASWAWPISGPELNEVQFRECFDQEMSLGAVLKDIGIARALEVNATPTLFVNGQRLTGLRGLELRQQFRSRMSDRDLRKNAQPEHGPLIVKR